MKTEKIESWGPVVNRGSVWVTLKLYVLWR